MQLKFIVPSLSALAVAGLFFTPCAKATSEAPPQTDLDGVLVTAPAQPLPGLVEAASVPAQEESGYLGTAASYAYAGIANTLYYGTVVGPVYHGLSYLLGGNSTPPAQEQPVAEEPKLALETAAPVPEAPEAPKVEESSSEQAAPAPVADIEDLLKAVNESKKPATIESKFLGKKKRRK